MYEKYIFAVMVVNVDGFSAFLYIFLKVLILCFRIFVFECDSGTSNLTE